MATYITVEQQAAQELLEANARQTTANRAGLARQERVKESLRQVPPAAPQINPSPRRALGDEELAAVRRRRPTGYRFIDYSNASAFSSDPYFAEEYRLIQGNPLSKLKAIRVVVGGSGEGACPGRDADPAPFFMGMEGELASFVSKGGVLWINNEFSNLAINGATNQCGINPSVFNAYLSSAFGSSIGFADDTQPEGTRIPLGPFDEIIRNPLAYTPQAGIAPPYFYTAATSSITGGTPYYSSAYGPVCSFERLGRGFLVLSGDSDGTADYPSFTEGTGTFIDALRSLR